MLYMMMTVDNQVNRRLITFVVWEIGLITGMAIQDDMLFWSNFSDNKIYRTFLNGTAISAIADVKEPGRIASDNRAKYVTRLWQWKIHRSYDFGAVILFYELNYIHNSH